MSQYVPCPPPVLVPVFPKTAPSSPPVWTHIAPSRSQTFQLLLISLYSCFFFPVISGVVFLPSAHSLPLPFAVFPGARGSGCGGHESGDLSEEEGHF